MTANPKPQPSFLPGRRWKIGFDVVVRTALVLAIVVMVNYLGGLFPKRFYPQFAYAHSDYPRARWTCSDP